MELWMEECNPEQGKIVCSTGQVPQDSLLMNGKILCWLRINQFSMPPSFFSLFSFMELENQGDKRTFARINTSDVPACTFAGKPAGYLDEGMAAISYSLQNMVEGTTIRLPQGPLILRLALCDRSTVTIHNLQPLLILK